MGRSRVRPLLVAGVVGALLVVGGLVVATRLRPYAAFGWTSSTPLTNVPWSTSPGVIVLDAWGIGSLLLAAVGLALVAGSVGFALARRRFGRPPTNDGGPRPARDDGR